MRPRKRRLPGFAWRVLAWNEATGEKTDLEFDGSENVCFDELVIGDGRGGVWFHIEQMNDRHWWMHVGHLHLNARIRPNGRVEVSGWLDCEGEIQVDARGLRVVEGGGE